MRRPDVLPSASVTILRTLNVPAALALSGALAPGMITGGVKRDGQHAGPEEVALAGMHQTRLRYPSQFTLDELMDSRDWLQDHGWRVI